MRIGFDARMSGLPLLFAVALSACGGGGGDDAADGGVGAGEGPTGGGSGGGECDVSRHEVVRPWAKLESGNIIGPLETDGETLFIQVEGTIEARPVSGGPWTEIWRNPEDIAMPLSFWARETDLLLWQGRSGGFSTVPKAGGAATPLPPLPFDIAGLPSVRFIGGFDADGTLYAVSETYLDGEKQPGTLHRIDLATGSTTPLALLQQVEATDVAVLGDFVYVVASEIDEAEEFGPPRSVLLRVPKAGGSVEQRLTGFEDPALESLGLRMHGPAGGRLWFVATPDYGDDIQRSLDARGVYFLEGDGELVAAQAGYIVSSGSFTGARGAEGEAHLHLIGASTHDVVRLSSADGAPPRVFCSPAPGAGVYGLAVAGGSLYVNLHDDSTFENAVVRVPLP
jgi:hypothetical protein